MSDGHPAKGVLRRFVQGDLAGEESLVVVRHLIEGCAECGGRTAELWSELVALRGAPAPRAEEPSWSGVARTVDGRRVAIDREQRDAAELFEKVAGQPPARRLLFLRNTRRFATPAACLRLIEAAFDLGFDEPHHAVAAAELGLEAVRQLDPAYGPALLADLEARAWGVLGNARRIVSDLNGAEQALERARERLELGTGDPIESARLDSFLSSQRTAQRRFDEALRLCRRAVAGYRRAGDDPMAAQTMVDEGVVLGHLGRYDEAVHRLDQALEEIDPRQTPRNVLAARHNQILFLQEAGRTDEALARVPEARELARLYGRRIDQLRVKWLEAKLLAAVGRLQAAASGLGEVADAFLEEEMPYAAAIAALERASLLLRLGRTDEIRQIATESLAVFRSLGIERESLMALTLLRRAVEREALTATVLEEAAEALQREAPRFAARRPGVTG